MIHDVNGLLTLPRVKRMLTWLQLSRRWSHLLRLANSRGKGTLAGNADESVTAFNFFRDNNCPVTNRQSS